jgi:flagellar export protein FliJ
MKKFSFRLERLLHLKQGAEDQQAKKLVNSMQSAEEVRARAENSAGRKEEAEKQMGDIRTGGIPAGVLHAAELALRAVRGKSDSDARDYRTAKANVVGEEARFHEARKERRSLERLREKHHHAWSSELKRYEQAETDAIAARTKPRLDGGKT